MDVNLDKGFVRSAVHTPLPRESRHEHVKELSSLDARINSLSNATWVKPACYTALSLAGLGAAAVIGMNISQNQVPPSPPPPPSNPPVSTKSTSFGDVKIETLSEAPRIFKLPNFLTEKECDHLIDLSQGKLKPS